MHTFLVWACKSQDFAQSQNFFERLHDCETVTFRNSELNEHLFSIGITNIKRFMCGQNTESTEHFLLNCFLYYYEINNLLSNLTGVLEKQPATMTKEILLIA